MAEIFTIEDANQYLTGVWVGVKQDDGTLMPWYCHDIKINRKGKVVLKLIREGSELMKHFEALCDDDVIDISCPDLGAINVNGIPLFLTRRTQRQWRRGWRSSQTNFTDPSMDFRYYTAGDEQRKFRKDTRRTELIDAIYNPKFVTMSNAVEQIFKGEGYGAAINRSYYVYCNQQCKLPVIGYKSQDIATIDEEMNINLFPDSIHLTESLSEAMAE